MIRGGDNLEEALINYLYHQDNLYYVDENTFKLIPIHAFDKEAEEWAKSPKAYLDIDVIKASLKYELNSIGEKKKHQKKQKKKKSKKKY
jgi:phosphoglycerol transferase MdoB-like AlkP superfamily enzyme